MTPRNFWTVGLGWYAACMALTFWLKGLKGATTVVALAGVPWAITCWVWVFFRESQWVGAGAEKKTDFRKTRAHTGPLRARNGIDPRTRSGANIRRRRRAFFSSSSRSDPVSLPRRPVQLSSGAVLRRLWHHVPPPAGGRALPRQRREASPGRRSVPSDEFAQLELPTALIRQ